MECSHLDIWLIPISKAKLSICKKVGRRYGRFFYSPSIFQLQEYCRKNQHKRCPFFMRSDGEVGINPVVSPVKRFSIPDEAA